MKYLRAAAALLVTCSSLGCTYAEPSSPVAVEQPHQSPVALQQLQAPPPDTPPASATPDSITEGNAVFADAETFTIRETKNADAIVASMHDDFLACFKKHSSTAQSGETISLDILIGPDGKVKEAAGTSAPGLALVRECILRRVREATFDPPHGGGTLRIHVPEALRVEGPDGSS